MGLELHIRDLYRALDGCTIADASRLHARLRAWERTSRHAGSGRGARGEGLAHISKEIERSVARVAARRAAVPAIRYPNDLPVAARKDEIIAAIRDHQVVVVCGATGSGKTTQIPKMLLELGRGTRGYIGHTQPRRIAARAVAQRIAHELGTTVGAGGVVGYKVRFTDHTSERSLVKLMTDGILLAETQHDRALSQYDTIIIDEAHERSLNIDFLLGYLRQLLPRRPDLKIVITSATIDPKSFAHHFTLPGHPPPPIVEVSGRTYPVEFRYRPLEAQHPDEEDRDVEQAILHAVDELCTLHSELSTTLGDILIFLPGEREIRETAEALRKHPLKPAHRVDVIPLFARLSPDEQNRVFEPVPGRRRIILATNVAETSLTVPGIRSVIDAGVARISRYSPRTKVQRLPIEPISRASANQRAGRCGRTEPGVCIRLYSEEDFNARPEFTDPEILRTNLASVILQMKALDLMGGGGDIEQFPFIQPPSPQNVRDGYDTLLEIHALEGGGLRADLTSIGRQLARLPIDPRLGRMLIAADAERCLAEVLVITAALATQDPRERPLEKHAEADAAHLIFREEDGGGSDFLGQLKLWRELHKQQKHLSGNQFRKWCRDKFVSYLRFREWHDTHTQLRELMTEMGFPLVARLSRAGHGSSASPVHPHAKPENIHRAMLTGLLSSIARKNDATQRDVALGDGDYDGARGIKLNIFPGSVLFKKTGGGAKWIMAAEIVKTTRTYARMAAGISPQWIEQLAQHLVKRTYADPHWDAERAEAVVYESQSLYGLEIVKRRRVSFAPIDPAASRALFIQHALVGGEYLTNAKFFEHNHTLTRHIRQLQEKSRTNDLLADQSRRFEFFDRRVPGDVATGIQFEQWRRRAESREPGLLLMQKHDVLAPGVKEPPAEQFPDSILMVESEAPAQARAPSAPLRDPARQGAHGPDAHPTASFLLEYKFDAGAADDGITLIVPIDRVGELSQRRLDWLVPGVIAEKVEHLIRELPKALRASFVPVPQTVERVTARLRFGRGEFIEAMTSALREATNIFVARDQWHPERLPRHLVMNMRVVDAKGRTVMAGRDLGAIRREFVGQAEQSLVRLPEGPFNRSGVFHWDFGPLPERVEIEHAGKTFAVFPALNDEGGTEDVAIRPFASEQKARAAHAAGLRRLFSLHTRRECRSLIETTPGIEKLSLLHKALVNAQYASGSVKTLIDELAELTGQRAWEAAAPALPASTSPGQYEGADVRTKEQFESRLNAAWTRIGASGSKVFALAESILRDHLAIAQLLEDGASNPEFGPAMLDLRVQLAYLFAPGFWTRTPWEWLAQYPRYLAAMHRRLARLGGIDGIARDTRLIHEIAPWVLKLRVRVEQGAPSQRADPELIHYRWMLEEWRVALWGGQGGRQETLVPVSSRRIQEQWGRVVASDVGRDAG